MYSPLYFLAALGAGGLSVTFFLMLMFWIPHPGQPIPVFEDWVLAFQTGDLGTQALILGALSGVAFFVAHHVRLLVLNYRLMGQYRKTSDYQAFLRSPQQTQELAMPLATAMTVNASLIVGALFVPHLWSIVEYLFPVAMLVFLALGVWAMRLYARILRRATQGHVNLGGAASFAQVLPAFTFAMVAVGLAAPAALSETPWVVALSLVLSTFFAVSALVIAVIKTSIALSRMFSEGLDESALPTLWIWVPVLTVLSITFMRQDHGVTHTLGLASQGDWLMPLLLVVSAQVFVIVFGAIAMQSYAYLPRILRGEIHNAPAFSLICPGVALSVSLQFLINKGFVAAGVITKFSATYWALSAVPMVLTVMTIWVFFRLMHGFLKERDTLFSHANPVEAR
jgi:hypothetical protein